MLGIAVYLDIMLHANNYIRGFVQNLFYVFLRRITNTYRPVISFSTNYNLRKEYLD